MTHLKTALVALLAASALAPAALAEVVSNKNTATVTTADLDLSSVQDAEILLKRIQRAANKACRDWETVIPRKEQACRSQTVAETVSRLNINALGVAYVDVFGQAPTVASRD